MYFLALASDYDGTLAHDGIVGEASLRALRRLKESGRRVILVTGRELDEATLDLAYHLPAITFARYGHAPYLNRDFFARIARSMPDALTSRRTLGPADAHLLSVFAAILIAIAVIAVLWPPALAFPIALISAWLGVVMLIRARGLWRKRRRALRQVAAE